MNQQTGQDGNTRKKQLELSFPNLWDQASQETVEAAYSYADAYKGFLDRAKSERAFIREAERWLEQRGFVPLDGLDSLKPGMKVYQTFREKGLIAAVIGSQPQAGMNLIGAHVDAPRLDLKPIPVYEDQELVYFKTHYYGGIKKYQWPAIPLALHGRVYRADGSAVDLSIGEAADDPVLTITDLLPHLGKDQMAKKATEVITGEDLNVLVASRAYPQEDLAGRFKLAFLDWLEKTHGLLERDLVTAELQLVPAGQARDVGFDRSLIGAYAQDDRVCSYTALTALAAMETGERTGVCLLFDKEEVGSQGNTGAQSRVYETMLQELLVKSAGNQWADKLAFDRYLQDCQMLSADVSAAYDPTFASVYDIKNSSFLGRGLCLVKYVGARGKSGTSDASSEFFSKIVRAFDAHDIPWQTGELGKVDMGGGGTVAAYLANLGMEVIDCGVPVLSMHAPFEVTSKIDVYWTHRAYQAFYEHV